MDDEETDMMMADLAKIIMQAAMITMEEVVLMIVVRKTDHPLTIGNGPDALKTRGVQTTGDRVRIVAEVPPLPGMNRF